MSETLLDLEILWSWICNFHDFVPSVPSLVVLNFYQLLIGWTALCFLLFSSVKILLSRYATNFFLLFSRQYYDSFAFFRDAEQCNAMQTHLQGKDYFIGLVNTGLYVFDYMFEENFDNIWFSICLFAESVWFYSLCYILLFYYIFAMSLGFLL